MRAQEGYIGSILLKGSGGSDSHGSSVEKVKKAKDPKGPSTDVVADLTRKTGDMAVYAYWIRSVGWQRVCMFLACNAVFSFFVAFPRKSRMNSCTWRLCWDGLLIVTIEYWLKWWTDDEGGHIAYYLSIYFLLALGCSLSNAASIWSVLINIGPKTAETLHYTLLRIVMRFVSGVVVMMAVWANGLVGHRNPFLLKRIRG